MTAHYDALETRDPAAREADLFTRLPNILKSAELNLACYLSAIRGDRIDLPLAGHLAPQFLLSDGRRSDDHCQHCVQGQVRRDEREARRVREQRRLAEDRRRAGP